MGGNVSLKVNHGWIEEPASNAIDELEELVRRIHEAERKEKKRKEKKRDQ